MRVFAIDHARHSRKVHSDVFSNIFQHHRLDVLNAFIEKLSLPIYDGFDDAIDRLAAMFDVAE